MSASSAPRPRAGRILGGLLLLASGVLAFLVLRPVPESAVEEPPVVTASPPSSPTPLRAEGALLLAPTVDPTLAAIDRPSLPEEWAETVLDNAIQHLTGVNQTADAGFASLEDKGSWGPLTGEAGELTIGGETLNADDRSAVDVMVIAPREPGGLLSLGLIRREDHILTLHLVAGEDGSQLVRRLAGGVLPGDVLAAMVAEAEARGLTLQAAYWETPGDSATLALVDIRPAASATQALSSLEDSPTPGTPTPATITPTPLPTPAYESEIRLMVESGLLPLIEAAEDATGARQEAVERLVRNRLLLVTPACQDDDVPLALAETPQEMPDQGGAEGEGVREEIGFRTVDALGKRGRVAGNVGGQEPAGVRYGPADQVVAEACRLDVQAAQREHDGL